MPSASCFHVFVPSSKAVCIQQLSKAVVDVNGDWSNLQFGSGSIQQIIQAIVDVNGQRRAARVTMFYFTRSGHSSSVRDFWSHQARMPTTPRKSSIGASRRGPLKAHIPYRGDNPEVGKKTGIAVQHVQRQSDGFEPFDQVLLQADGRTPPRPKGRKKSLTAAAHQDQDDYGSDDGWEESMQLDSM